MSVQSAPYDGRLLIVEDDESMGVFATRVLTRAGFETGYVTSAELALEALEALDASAWDGVLTDVRLPGISGFELARRAKALRPALPVAVMTAYATAETERELASAPIDDFLTKPLTPETLTARMGLLVAGPRPSS